MTNLLHGQCSEITGSRNVVCCLYSMGLYAWAMNFGEKIRWKFVLGPFVDHIHDAKIMCIQLTTQHGGVWFLHARLQRVVGRRRIFSMGNAVKLLVQETWYAVSISWACMHEQWTLEIKSGENSYLCSLYNGIFFPPWRKENMQLEETEHYLFRICCMLVTTLSLRCVIII
jgi:hypothetical protein